MKTAAQRQHAMNQAAANEARYGKSSHGQRSKALMAAANGNLRPAEAILDMDNIKGNARIDWAEYDRRNDLVDQVRAKIEGMTMDEQLIMLLESINLKLDRIEARLEGGAVQSSFNAVSGQFAAVALSATIDKGKTYWKVQGGQFMKHGIMIWPEVLAATDFADASPMQAHDLTGYTAVYSENEEGQKKIISLSRAAALAPVERPKVDVRPKASPNGKKPIGKDAGALAAEQWRRECETAEDPLMFDTAMSKLASFFPDANGVQWAREQVFGEWSATEARAVTAGLLAYAEKRAALNGSVSMVESHAQAKVEAWAAFNRTQED